VGGVSRAAVLLDRDGTINVKAPPHEYITSRQEFVWLPGAADGLARLAGAGYVLAVVSNQRGVARGLVSFDVLEEIEQVIQRELRTRGCRITAFCYCPHEHEDNCDCRKPKPGMLLALARELDLDLASSWMIGDSESDVQAGAAAGCRTVRLAPSGEHSSADLLAGSLLDASRLIAAPVAAA
jgi:D-glycero-D-manno-heptose 1,7-bisphosphate phosphatase